MIMRTIRQISRDACSAACLMMALRRVGVPPRMSQHRLFLKIMKASRPLRVSTEAGMTLAALASGLNTEAYRSGGAVKMRECIGWVNFCERSGDFRGTLNESERRAIARKFMASYTSAEKKMAGTLHRNAKGMITTGMVARLIKGGAVPMVLVDDFFIDYKPPHDLHWVVVSGFSKGVFTVNDPGFITGRGVLRMERGRFGKAIATERIGFQRRMVVMHRNTKTIGKYAAHFTL